MFHLLATLGMGLVLAGAWLRRRRRLHVACMGAAGLVDYGTLVAIELSRTALATVMAGPSPFLAFHVAVSAAALLGYPVLAVLGAASVGKRPHWLPLHRRAGRVFLACRAAGYLSSWGL